jgi:hypothetical protein
MTKLKFVKPENYSGFSTQWAKYLPIIKKKDYVVRDISVGGDAPKDFIQIYLFRKVRRKNTKKWIGYIAKVAGKWYPVESITEYFLSKIGEELGLLMANSKLVLIAGQIRFLSQYFLNHQTEELVHGVDIYAGYISDKSLVEEIEKKQMAQEFFTFQFAEEAIRCIFPEEANIIIQQFVKMLVFDALIGNNDRHFYNWGVIRNTSKKNKNRFSPIYDTARGMFWNDSETKIAEVVNDKVRLPSYLDKYVKKSKPKTGWKGVKQLTHLQLVQHLYDYHDDYRKIITDLAEQKNENRVLDMIDKEFSMLLSINRTFLIKECLKKRFELIRNIKHTNHEQ